VAEYLMMLSVRAAEQGGGAWGLSPLPTYKSGGLISKIAHHFLCPKNILQGPFVTTRSGKNALLGSVYWIFLFFLYLLY